MAGPSGDVTLLFTDIEGSTRLWETHPDAMATALQRHDAVLRQVIGAHEGYVFKTVGDAFCAAFPPPGGGRCRCGDPAGPRAEPWPPEVTIRVRMGLHSGSCEERDGDYFGPVVNRTARLEASPTGVRSSSQPPPPPCLDAPRRPSGTLIDLGEHRLQGPEPARAGGPGGRTRLWRRSSRRCGACRTPPAPQPAPDTLELHRPPRGTDPPQRASRHRPPVTLTGPGGTGKTRLALQAGAEDLDGSADGVWFCDLSPLSHPDAVAREVATVLGVPEVPGRDPLDTLAESLVTRRLLLILDNCEHLLDATGTLVARLLAGCPGARGPGHQPGTALGAR